MAGPKVGVLHLLLHVICLNVVFLSCDDSHDSSGLKGSIVLGWVGVDAYILHLELSSNAYWTVCKMGHG